MNNVQGPLIVGYEITLRAQIDDEQVLECLGYETILRAQINNENT